MVKKITILVSILLLQIVPLVITSGSTNPSIYFTDQYGIETDFTFIYNTIYVAGNDFEPNTDFNVSMSSEAITDGMDMPVPTFNITTMITSDSDGNIPITEIWSQWNGPYLPVGEYTIIVDINDDGVYNEEIDVIDTINIRYMPGVSSSPGPEIPEFVTPEFPGGSIMAILAFLIAALLYRSQRLPIPSQLP